MKELKEYQIPYTGLKVGIHRFEYDVDHRFFRHFEGALINECNVKVKVEFEKKETFFIIRFFVDGTVRVECDRCLEPFDKEIFGDYVLYVKFSDDPASLADDDEVMYICREDPVIDIAQAVYDYINLCIPIQVIHPKTADGHEGCNPEVLKYLRTSAHEKTDDSEVDPRWAALKKLKD
ncbi:MAG: DUF177 domain-containing protein [Chitinophagales bacterium]|nr:DUF177 domain-containing protein [Chitinophagales bacterium]MDW8419502.1 DUF177 domain-containing protein [Chitinophagales bacterium]